MGEDAISAALYVRASTEMQVYSTENQKEALQRYAAGHNYRVVRIYEDDGRSGLTLSGRPGLSRLLQAALADECPFAVLLVYDISRWGRFQDADESAHYEYLCRRSGIQVIYVAEPFDNDGSTVSNVLKALKRAMAAEYSRELSDKVYQASRRLAAKGHAMHAAPYGIRRLLVDYNGQPKGILEHGQRKALQSDHMVFVPGPPKEIAVVRRIFRLYASYGMGFTDISNYLNKSATPGPGEGGWSDITVKHILQNEAYIGNIVYGRSTSRLKGKRSAVPPDQWVRCEGAFQTIVPKKTFLRVRERLAGMERARTDDYFLRPLRALFERKGYLSAAMIDAEPNMPSSRSYKWRFRGIINAYARVGYLSPYSDFVHWTKAIRTRVKEPVRELMLQKLKDLLDREGYLTGTLLNADPNTPSFRQYQWAFENLRSAYKLIGYEPLKTAPYRPRKAQLGRQDHTNEP